MSPFKYSLIFGAAFLLASCADDLSRRDFFSDGSISFSVDHDGNALGSRSGGDNASLSYINSVKVDHPAKPLWLHLEAAENPGSTNQILSTRALPVTLDNLSDFKVTATIADSEDIFIDNETVTKKSDNSWQTATTYYWPQNESLTFFCRQSSLPSHLTDLQAADKKFCFKYVVPKSEDDATDADAQEDFVMAIHTYSRSDVTGGVAEIKFKHPLAGICFVEDESLDDENLRIARIELSGLYAQGACVFNGNAVNTAASHWETSGEKESFVQTVSFPSDGVAVPVSSSNTVRAVAKPFMVIPQKDLSDFKVKVTLADGSQHEADLSGVGELDPGKMYVFTLSGLDAKYPPVENLQGMAGNGTVSLNWDNPEATYDHIRQCGVTIRITQKKSGDSSDISVLTTSIHWGDSHDSLFPSDKSLLDLFAYVKSGLDSDGNEVNINTRRYDEFECDVYADYYNTKDEDFDTAPKIHQSIARTITIKPGITDDTVLFYIPEGAKTPEGLLDDDDVAAWEWFRRTYPQGTYVTKDNLAQKQAEGFNVLWVPCGVQLRDGGYGTAVPGDADAKISTAENILSNPEILPFINLDSPENAARYWDYKEKYAAPLQELGNVPGVYDDWRTGTIRRLNNVNDYFTDNDIRAIRDFYGTGGNLLLTTFSIELIYEFEVITAVNRYYGPGEGYPYRPNVHFFNEIKPSSIWFIRPDFGDHSNSAHKIYSGMFKCKGSIFPETAKDIFDGDYPVFVASDAARSVEMFPLLSMGASACENNNVVWDFNNAPKAMENLEKDNNARFLGTWGQIDDNSVGVAVEFFPGQTEDIWPWEHSEGYIRDCWCPSGASDSERERIRLAIQNHGRCIAIGLGAYEFNNGLNYDPDGEVLNSYQSNVQLMTRNALNYLMTKPDNEK